jgi:GWxTD domain-containing protein
MKLLLILWIASLHFWGFLPIKNQTQKTKILVFHSLSANENRGELYLKILFDETADIRSARLNYEPIGCMRCKESDEFSVSDEEYLVFKTETEIVLTISLLDIEDWEGVKINIIHGEDRSKYVYPIFFESDFQFDYPEFNLLIGGKTPVFHHFINEDNVISPEFSVGPAKELTVFFYDHAFEPAIPPMSDLVSQGKSFGIDSVFTISEMPVKLEKEGLYFVQSDTTSFQGHTFIVRDKYFPELVKPETLVDPIRYLLNNSEIEQLNRAQDKKRAFDKLILELTPNVDRAKRLIKSYFFRVKIANLLFTTYKEGWKTDMGMIFIIFGRPDEIVTDKNSETWRYKIDNQPDLKFEFMKIKTIFSPRHYVLKRKKDYAKDWFRAVELWRNSRMQ